MKKNIVLFLLAIVIFITGCELNNNPTSKVEELLSKYQKLDDEIVINYADLANTDELTDEQIDRYKNVIESQYKSLSYEIKEEEIDGDNAIVTTQIEVINYKEVLDKYSIDNYDIDEYYDLVLDDLEKAKDKVTYTIDFEVIKENDEWVINNLNNEQRQKLLGIY